MKTDKSIFLYFRGWAKNTEKKEIKNEKSKRQMRELRGSVSRDEYLGYGNQNGFSGPYANKFQLSLIKRS